MQRKAKYLIAGGAVVLAGGAAGVGVVSAVTDDDGTEVPITGEAYDRASAVALEHTGGGRVTETEVGDEEGYYEVEVTLDDGRQVDVHLTEDFTVIGTEADGTDDEGGADDD